MEQLNFDKLRVDDRTPLDGVYIDTGFIQHYAPVLTDTRAPVGLDERLLMDRHGELAVYYAPFEYLNREAKVVLVGITPGPTQMDNAVTAARRALLTGSSHNDAIRQAKQTAAFSGTTLRTNLVAQLNDWGVHTWLGLGDAAELFGSAQHLVQTTSLLRFPVFKNGEKYEGNPSPTRNPLLRRVLMGHFVREVQALPNAVFIALGTKVAEVIHTLVTDGVLTADRVVTGMFHPSGENGYRIKYILGDRSGSLPHRTNPKAYDDGRTAFQRRYLACSSRET